MHHRSSLASLLCLASAGAAIVSASPTPTRLSERASSCTFTDAAAATESKTSCSSITLKDIEVPAGKTLDLTDLNDGTKVLPVFLPSNFTFVDTRQLRHLFIVVSKYVEANQETIRLSSPAKRPSGTPNGQVLSSPSRAQTSPSKASPLLS